jgi:hypothetical protein
VLYGYYHVQLVQSDIIDSRSAASTVLGNKYPDPTELFSTPKCLDVDRILIMRSAIVRRGPRVDAESHGNDEEYHYRYMYVYNCLLR